MFRTHHYTGRIGDTHVVPEIGPINQGFKRGLAPNELRKGKPRTQELRLYGVKTCRGQRYRYQTSLKLLICKGLFANYGRVTVSRSDGASGGSHGGRGGERSGSSNPIYGDFTDPGDPGSGGGTIWLGEAAGNGGGLIRIVAQTLNLEGVIRVDGGIGALAGAGGGSGGGLRIDVGTLAGNGQITAGGGIGRSRPGRFGGGGGWGRIAVYYQSAPTFNFAGISAAGGAGSAAPNGQDGTVFLQQQTFVGWAPVGMDPPILRVEARPIRSLVPNSFPVHSAATRSDGKYLKVPVLKKEVAEIQSPFSPTEGIERKTYRALTLPAVVSGPKNRYLEMAANNAGADGDFDPIYTYDLNGNRVAMIDPTGLTIYTYNALNRLTSITNPSGQTTTFTYDALSRRTSMTHDNGVETTYSYDVASQLLSLVHQLGATTINSFIYTYDDVGNRLSKTDNNGTAEYTYDALNRLVEAVNPLPSNPLESFTYDEVGNRVDSNQNGLSTFNVANQLNEDPDFTYAYDANGNQIQKMDKTTLLSTQFEYNAENQLIRVVREDGSVVTYKYDGLGRRIAKDVDGVVTGYIYDKEDILLELDGSNNIVARYTHGPGIDEPLIMERDLDSSGTFGASEKFSYQADGLGSVIELTDASGIVARTYVYDSFGQIVDQVGTLLNPYTYTGREFDEESGLYYYRERYYEPRTGRFLQTDPARGILRIPTTQNPYLYVGNNPIIRTDPSGQFLVTASTIIVSGRIGGTLGAVNAALTGQDPFVGAALGAGAGITITIATAALAGSAVVTAIGVTGTVFVGALTGAALGGLADWSLQVETNLVKGKSAFADISGSSIALSALTGSVAGVFGLAGLPAVTSILPAASDFLLRFLGQPTPGLSAGLACPVPGLSSP